MPGPVLSTYRLQLRGDAFTFADAEDMLDYLAALGISHLYLSPILTAAPGSTHGYDVTDPTTVSAELGGADGLARLSAAARDRGLGLIVDIVPNHLGVEQPRHNAWWWDVLRNGRKSPYASYFDIDWDADPDGRILLPVLGSDDDVDALEVDGEVLRLGDRQFPISPGTGSGSGAQVHDRQHYRLIGWRNGVCGYRRFFSITSLAGLRQEDPDVFDASHVEVRRWFAEGLVDGLRIDHPDGLTDPASYLARLRKTRRATMPTSWSRRYWPPTKRSNRRCRSTAPPATTRFATWAGCSSTRPGARRWPPSQIPSGSTSGAVGQLTAELKTVAATDTLASELNRLRRTVVAAAGADHPLLARRDHRAAHQHRRLPVRLPGPVGHDVRPPSPKPWPPDSNSRRRSSWSTAALEHRSPQRGSQQLCGAVTAKAVEDCLFYRDPTLVSLNEVGGEPDRFGVSAAEFHHSAAVRSRRWPTAMTTLTTHDTKRGEDVRARIGVLSQVPALWAEMVAGWEAQSPPPQTPATGLFLWQNIFGVWPVTGAVDDTLRHRLHAYAEKAIREAHQHTSWNDPDTAFEAAVHDWLRRGDRRTGRRRTDRPGRAGWTSTPAATPSARSCWR